MHYEMPKGPIQVLANVLFFVGLGLYLLLALVLDGTPWIGLGLMTAGVLLSISLLLVEWRRQRSGV